MNKLIKISILFIFPIILIFLSVKVANNRGYFWKDPDPDYCYLMNGLSLASKKGKIGHIDHPGTPVQIISGKVIKIVYKFRKTNQDLITDVLLNPELYLKNIAWFFASFNIILVFLLGLITFIFTKNLFYGLLFQSIPFTSKMLILQGFYNATPEPFLLSANLILFGICILLIYKYPISVNPALREDSGLRKILKSNYWPALFAIIISFSLASKIYSAPLFIIPLFLFKDRLSKIKYIIYTILFFIIFTFPIIDQYKAFCYWLFRLVSHEGFYGHGVIGLLDLQSFFLNLKTIFLSYPLIIIVLTLSISLLVVNFKKGNKNLEVKLLMAFIIFQLLEIVVIAKQYYVHYIIPVMPSFTFTFFLFLFMIKLKLGYKKILTSLFIVINIIIVSFQLKYLFKNKNVNQIVSTQDNDSSDEFIKIFSYGCSSPIYALDFGNYYSNRTFYSQLDEIYKEKYFYDIWNKRFYDWKGDTIFLDSLYKMNHKLMLKGRKNILEKYKPEFQMKFMNRDGNDNFLITPENDK